MKHIFLLGKEGFNCYNSTIYGIIYNIISNSKDPDVMYYVSNLSFKKRFNTKNLRNVHFFNIHLPNLGRITYMLYDFLSLKKALKHARRHKPDNVTVFLFSTRSGVFLPLFKGDLKRTNVSLNIYCENDYSSFDDWTTPFRLLSKFSLDMCVKYASCLLFTKDATKEYFHKTYNNANLRMSKLDFCSASLDKPFRTFLNEHGITYYNYYLLIDNSHSLGRISFVVRKFLESKTSKKLVILCRKDSLLYRNLIFEYDLSKDDRIKIFNIQRFIHFIPHLTKYCHAYIHSNIFGVNQDFIKSSFCYDIINIVLDCPFNQNIKLNNVLYYNDKNLTEVISKADNLAKKTNPTKSSTDNVGML